MQAASESLEGLMHAYAESHRDPRNQMLHKVCVPAILFSVFGMLKSIPTPFSAIDLSHLSALAILLYYARFRSARLLMAAAALFAAMLFSLDWLGPHRLAISAVIFIVAWIGQFIGHHIEGKRPSFFQDILFLLVGPLWVLRKLGWI